MSRLTHWKDPDAQPTLSHDVEQWIQDHSHGDLYHRLEQQQNISTATIGLLTCLEARVAHLEEQFQCREREWELRVGSLEDRVDSIEEFVVDTSDWYESLRAVEPRGPHD